jgi:hypothetical protein
LRNTLEHFQSAASDVVMCLKEVLHNDRDMRESCLTDKKRAFHDAKRAKTPSSEQADSDAPAEVVEGKVWDKPHGSSARGPRLQALRGWGNTRSTSLEAGSPTNVLSRVREGTLLDLEVMLETHMRMAADIRQQTEQILKHMDTRQAILGSTLDAYRNHLIDINLRMTIIGLGVSFGTLASGLFGEPLLLFQARSCGRRRGCC